MKVPELFPSPFDELGPCDLARAAALELQRELASGFVAPGIPTSVLEGPAGGKMFGVLVARGKDGRLLSLRAFSGMLDGRWEVEGFVPPVFDRAVRDAAEPEGERCVKALLSREEAFARSELLLRARSEDDAFRADAVERLQSMKRRHDEHRAARHKARRALPEDATEALHALAQQSRADKAERRRLEEALESQGAVLRLRRARLERRLLAHARLRTRVCRALMKRIFDAYELRNARGERRALRSLFANGEPPSGAGDCAGPKLLSHAYRHGLTPVAMAEFWWGAAPLSGGRVSGAFYGACKEKCGPLLPFMLEGLQVAPQRVFRPPAPPEDGLRIVFEDEWLCVVDKPCGVLSVPARDEAHGDSVLARLRARYPDATGPLLVHRLDLDTSGLLVAAKDARTHASLQRQFLTREVEKQYAAWLEGDVRGERGTIDLALRVDVNDRPRQIHDPVHGKRALTEWAVVERLGGRTRVALFPRTGRTHQLRVHAAHPLGLGAPIVGDRLYGHASERLLLHAETLSFRHPATGEPISFRVVAPF